MHIKMTFKFELISVILMDEPISDTFECLLMSALVICFINEPLGGSSVTLNIQDIMAS